MQELERSIIGMLVKQLIMPLALALEDQLRARAAAVCLPGTVQARPWPLRPTLQAAASHC